MTRKQPMATILQFQPRDRHGAPAREADARELDSEHDETTSRPSDRFGEIVLFTGVRYSRWDEQSSSDAGEELMPAE